MSLLFCCYLWRWCVRVFSAIRPSWYGFFVAQWSLVCIGLITMRLTPIDLIVRTQHESGKSKLTLLNTLGLLGMTAKSSQILAFILQFVLNELPAHSQFTATNWLCDGRVWLGAGMWFAGPQPRYHGASTGALYGVATSLRQVSPARDSGHSLVTVALYWDALLHLGLCVVRCNHIGCCRDLDTSTNKAESHEPYKMSNFDLIVCLLAIVVVALNAIATFVECGPYCALITQWAIGYLIKWLVVNFDLNKKEREANPRSFCMW